MAIHSFFAGRSELEKQCGEQAGNFTSSIVWNGTHRDFPHLTEADRWPATSKQARCSALISFSRYED